MDNTQYKQYRSLSSQLVIALFGFSIVVTGAFTAIQFGIDWSREHDVFAEEAEKTIRISSLALAEHLWSQNDIGMQSQMDSMLQREEIFGAEIYNDHKKSLAKKFREGDVPKHTLVVLHKVSMEGNDHVGDLEITFSQDRVVNRLFSRLATLILLNSLKASLVSLLVYQFVRRRMAEPLVRLSSYFKNNSNARMDSNTDPAFQRNSPFHDEIEELTKHISQREKTLATFVKIQEDQIFTQANKISESEEIIQREKARAELSARLAQLGEMATGIAHEINNPLAIISGNIFRLKKKPKSGDAPIPDKTIFEVADVTERMVQRISGIIRGLKSYARDGSHDPFTPANPGIIVRDMTTLTVGRLISKNVSFTVKDDTNEGTMLECREVQISQALVILTNNALDAVKSLPNPWIHLHVFEEPNNIVFKLTDCGTGIPKDIQDKIFKAHFTTKAVHEGTGLGLSIAYNIVAGHNGEIYVDNDSPNTCFVIRLPKKQNVQTAISA